MFKGVLSNNIEMNIDDEGKVVFNATVLLVGLSRADLDGVLSSVDVKEGTIGMVVEPLVPRP